MKKAIIIEDYFKMVDRGHQSGASPDTPYDILHYGDNKIILNVSNRPYDVYYKYVRFAKKN